MKGGGGQGVRSIETLSKRKAGDFHCHSEFILTTWEA